MKVAQMAWDAEKIRCSFSTNERHYFVALGVLVAALLGLAWRAFDPSEKLTGTQALYFVLLTALAAVICETLVMSNFEIVGLDACRPLSLYGFFYLLYYVVPGFLLLMNNCVPEHDLLPIAGLMWLGYVAFWTGLKLVGLRLARTAAIYTSVIEIRALAILCSLGIVIVATYNVWRISIGQFYTHAAYYQQAPTVFASFMDVFASQFQLPLILLLGLLAGVRSVNPRGRRIQYLFYIYSATIFSVFVISSQVRMAVTSLVLFLVAKKMSSASALKFRYIVLAGGLSFLALIAVQGFRNVIQPEDVAQSKNQLTFSVDHISSTFSAALDDWTSDVQAPTIARAVGQPIFLSEVMDAIERGVPHPYGEDLQNSLYALVPRVLWPNKPELVPLQLAIRKRFGLLVHDDSPGPLVAFFVDGGWPGVFIGFLCLGCLLGHLTRATLASKGFGMWIILAWTWSAVVQVETELVIGTATMLRNAIVVCIIYKLLVAADHLLLPVEGPKFRVAVKDTCQSISSPMFVGSAPNNLRRWS